MEEHTPTVPLDDILAFTDIPPVAHEFAALLQAGTSYELVDWLAKRLQFAAEQLAQEHKRSGNDSKAPWPPKRRKLINN